jgi:hypothetical protein
VSHVHLYRCVLKFDLVWDSCNTTYGIPSKYAVIIKGLRFSELGFEKRSFVYRQEPKYSDKRSVPSPLSVTRHLSEVEIYDAAEIARPLKAEDVGGRSVKRCWAIRDRHLSNLRNTFMFYASQWRSYDYIYLFLFFLRTCYLISSLRWDFMQCRLVSRYRRFGKTYWSHLQRLRNQSCPETSVTNYQLTPHNIPEERKPHLYRGGSLNARNVLLKRRIFYVKDVRCNFKISPICRFYDHCLRQCEDMVI